MSRRRRRLLEGGGSKEQGRENKEERKERHPSNYFYLHISSFSFLYLARKLKICGFASDLSQDPVSCLWWVNGYSCEALCLRSIDLNSLIIFFLRSIILAMLIACMFTFLLNMLSI